MGLRIIRRDPVKGKQKTVAELQAENEELRARVEALEAQDTVAILAAAYREGVMEA